MCNWLKKRTLILGLHSHLHGFARLRSVVACSYDLPIIARYENPTCGRTRKVEMAKKGSSKSHRSFKLVIPSDLMDIRWNLPVAGTLTSKKVPEFTGGPTGM